MERVPSSPYVTCPGDAERAEPGSLSRRATAPFRLVMRVRVVLLAADGLANCAIAEQLGIREDTARKPAHPPQAAALQPIVLPGALPVPPDRLSTGQPRTPLDLGNPRQVTAASTNRSHQSPPATMIATPRHQCSDLQVGAAGFEPATPRL
jgi:hypothetical protein